MASGRARKVKEEKLARVMSEAQWPNKLAGRQRFRRGFDRRKSLLDFGSRKRLSSLSLSGATLQVYVLDHWPV